MASIASNLSPTPHSLRGPAEDPAARIRRNIACRRSELASSAPKAVELAAEALTGLHEVLSGAVTACRGPRGERYARGQITGERALPLEDLARLILHAPRAAAEALRPLVRAAGYRMVPVSPLKRCLFEATADLDVAAARVVATVIKALADGVIEDHERRECLGVLAHLQRRVSEAERALEGAQ